MIELCKCHTRNSLIENGGFELRFYLSSVAKEWKLAWVFTRGGPTYTSVWAVLLSVDECNIIFLLFFSFLVLKMISFSQSLSSIPLVSSNSSAAKKAQITTLTSNQQATLVRSSGRVPSCCKSCSQEQILLLSLSSDRGNNIQLA